MPWSRTRKANLADDLDLLIGDLCMRWGFCNALRADDLLRDHEILDATTFAEAVLQAEGMNAETEVTWKRRTRNKFTERYGASVSASNYAANALRHPRA